MARHARGRGGRHVAQYQGWGQPQAPDHTPPMGFPAVDVADELAMSYAPPPVQYPVPSQPPVQYPVPSQPPRQGMSTPVRLLLVAAGMVACLFLGAALILSVAFVMGSPPPASADDTRQPVTQTVVVAGDQIKVKARQLCPTEDSCDIDYEGRGVWTITRVVP